VKGLTEALLRSPSSRGRNPWEFVLVDDPDLLDRLSRSKPRGAAFLAGAPLGIVVLGDAALTDMWVEDCAIASIIVQLAAHAMGLGSCWIQVRARTREDGGMSEAYIRDLLGVPDNYGVESIIAVGHRDEEMAGHPESSLQYEKIHRNRFSG